MVFGTLILLQTIVCKHMPKESAVKCTVVYTRHSTPQLAQGPAVQTSEEGVILSGDTLLYPPSSTVEASTEQSNTALGHRALLGRGPAMARGTVMKDGTLGV